MRQPHAHRDLGRRHHHRGGFPDTRRAGRAARAPAARPRRRLRGRAPAGQRRFRAGVGGAGPEARPPCRRQGPASRAGGVPFPDRAVQARGAGGGQAAPPGHRAHLRRGRARGAGVVRHAADRGHQPARGTPGRPAAGGRGAADPAGDGGGAGRGAQGRHRAPRHQAREHHARRRGAPGVGHGLRHRQVHGGGGRDRPHGHGHDHRHAGLHEPRAGDGLEGDRAAVGHLLPGCGRLRDGGRRDAVPGRQRAGAGDEASRGAGAVARHREGGSTGRPRHRCEPVPYQRTSRALEQRRRAGGLPRGARVAGHVGDTRFQAAAPVRAAGMAAEPRTGAHRRRRGGGGGHSRDGTRPPRPGVPGARLLGIAPGGNRGCRAAARDGRAPGEELARHDAFAR